MEIVYKKKAVKAIEGMPKATKQRIKSAIEGLTLSPPKGNINQCRDIKTVVFG